MKIGILGHGFMEWGGGIDFLRLIAESLREVDPNIEFHFIFPLAGPRYQIAKQRRHLKNLVNKSLGRACFNNKPPSMNHLSDLVSSIGDKAHIHKIDSGMAALRRITTKLEIELLLPAINPLKNQTVPWIGYIYDYQHAHHPEFFTREEVLNRNLQFKEMLDSAEHVIVNAKSVVDDINHFNPEHRAKIIPLPFSAAPNPKWLKLAPADLEKHTISAPYFIISNQFWQHKDHPTAWYALELVLRQRPGIQLVCTGDTHDYRNPEYFGNLKKLAKDLGIWGQIRILGLIPKEEQIRLIRGAVAMLQPTLFEGGPGGGAVFDAASLGVPCIVSNIAVNLELNEPCVTFFQARDPASLAEKMINALDQESQKINPTNAKLIMMGKSRREMCGATLINVIRDII